MPSSNLAFGDCKKDTSSTKDVDNHIGKIGQGDSVQIYKFWAMNAWGLFNTLGCSSPTYDIINNSFDNALLTIDSGGKI